MPGSSLWLLPPPTHPLSTLLSTLILKTSRHFNSPHHFVPHITLTADIPPSTHSSPQSFLDALPLPAANCVNVRLAQLHSEDVFFKKLYIAVEKDGMEELARVARTAVDGGGEKDGAAKMWVEKQYRPHLSLLYHECAKIDAEGMEEIWKLVREAGLSLDGEGELGGWVGGRVVLVPTSEPIDQWAVLAERTL
ncbi:2, 3 cyclic phosphodiesterase [Melanomma pulvis-pyrius CBS 109.77]|uniref:2, 3 cyclic phosphodiesterase n=1 Tax=Melanomma pulvis-pyrius CBS 109.77 TaxID=1314802 RepID=A0A6A6XIW5_9PLEO|nr:2, 3 cyclic phosphodiesterase [Melanomma pulvis-pyrius CBS 109.77]